MGNILKLGQTHFCITLGHCLPIATLQRDCALGTSSSLQPPMDMDSGPGQATSLQCLLLVGISLYSTFPLQASPVPPAVSSLTPSHTLHCPQFSLSHCHTHTPYYLHTHRTGCTFTIHVQILPFTAFLAVPAPTHLPLPRRAPLPPAYPTLHYATLRCTLGRFAALTYQLFLHALPRPLLRLPHPFVRSPTRTFGTTACRARATTPRTHTRLC